MNQLVIVSTQMEVQPFLYKAGFPAELLLHNPLKLRDNLSLLITGVGSPETIFSLTRLLASNFFDRIIQVGVAGSYNRDFDLGTLVEVGEDCFADLGIDDRGEFKSLFDVGLVAPNQEPYIKGRIINPIQGDSKHQIVRGITVNTTTGSEEIIHKWKELYQPDIESMEGAAALYVCLQYDIPVIQVRSISNYVEPRKRDSWKLDLAIQNLNNWLINFVNISSQE